MKRVEIKLWRRQGKSERETARLVGCNRKTVKKWDKKQDFSDGRVKSGRKSKITSNTKRVIEDEMKENFGSSLRKCARRLNFSDYQQRSKLISHSSIKKHINKTDWGKKCHRSYVKPLLSWKNIQDRLSFAYNAIENGYCDGTIESEELRDHILFTDESKIELDIIAHRQNYRIRTNDKSKVPIELNQSIH
jgi:transposase